MKITYKHEPDQPKVSIVDAVCGWIGIWLLGLLLFDWVKQLHPEILEQLYTWLDAIFK